MQLKDGENLSQHLQKQTFF